MVEKSQVLDVLREVEDPEIMMNIVDLGLIYRLEPKEDVVEIDFTLTFPGCPAADYIRQQIVDKVEQNTQLPVEANLVWDPPWRPEFMTDEAKISLGYPV